MATIGVSGSASYVVVEQSVTWTAARDAAAATGGHLVTLTTAAEDAFVRSLIDPRDYWIGLTDEAVEGTFEWVTGEAFSFTNWQIGEPNNNDNQDYGTGNYFGPFTPGAWDDNFNGANVPTYVVEFDSTAAFKSAANPFSDSADRFVGSQGNDKAFAGGGDDTLLGGAGGDKLTGGRGRRCIRAGRRRRSGSRHHPRL